MSHLFSKAILLVFLVTIPNAHAGFFSDIVDSMTSSDESMTEDEKAHPEAYHVNLSGVKKHNAQDYQGAIADYTHAIELWPEYALAYSNRANSKSFLDDRAGQVADDEKAVALDPNNLGYKNSLSVARNDLQWATMLSLEEKSNPQAYVLFQSGMAKFNAKDYQGAITDYTGAIKFDPKFAEAYKSRGSSKGWLQDYQGWLEDLNRAISLHSKNPVYYASRATAKSYLGDWAGQVTDGEKAVSMEPYNQAYITARDSAKANLSKLVFTALNDGDVAKAEKLLGTAKIDLSFKYSNMNRTPLSWFAWQGNMEIVKFLVTHGADINAGLPLHAAVENGHQAIVEYLIAHGADINSKNFEGDTPLHFSTFPYSHPSKAIEKLLIAKGADVTIKNNKGYTAFEWNKWEEKNKQEQADKEYEARRYARWQAEQAEIERKQAEQNARDMADLQGNRGGYWQMGVEATQRDLQNMQQADAARRNADYRRQNNCSAGDTRAECR